MIAVLDGVLQHKTAGNIVVMVGGVGYRLFIPVSTFYSLPREGESVRLRVHTHVREDILALYGFLTEIEETLFARLISVANVGPSLALKILSGLEPSELVRAIRTSDVKRLSSIPGVGKKTAERLIVELKDKLPDVGDSAEPSATAAPLAPADDLVSALVNLGYARPSAEDAARRVLSEDTELSFEQALKRALRSLSA